MPVIRIEVSAAQRTKLRQGKPIQVASRSAEKKTAVDIELSEREHKKYLSRIAHGKGMRLVHYRLLDASAPLQGEGIKMKKVLRTLGKAAKVALNIGTAVIPKDIAKNAATVALASRGVPGASFVGPAAVDALYASQGRGVSGGSLLGNLKKGAKLATSIIPKDVVQGVAKVGLEKAGLSTTTADALSKIGTNAGYAVAGSGVCTRRKFAKGSQEAKDFMASLRAKKRKGTRKACRVEGGGIFPIGTGLYPIGGSVCKSHSVGTVKQTGIADMNGKDFLRSRG